MLKEKEIQNNNKLIVEFMKLKTYKHYDQILFKEIQPKRWKIDIMARDIVSTEFHFSLDWLIPIIEKIEELGFTVIQNRKNCIIKNKTNFSVNYLSDTRILSTWFAIIEFIKWYNKNKKTNKIMKITKTTNVCLQ